MSSSESSGTQTSCNVWLLGRSALSTRRVAFVFGSRRAADADSSDRDVQMLVQDCRVVTRDMLMASFTTIGPFRNSSIAGIHPSLSPNDHTRNMGTTLSPCTPRARRCTLPRRRLPIRCRCSPCRWGTLGRCTACHRVTTTCTRRWAPRRRLQLAGWGMALGTDAWGSTISRPCRGTGVRAGILALDGRVCDESVLGWILSTGWVECICMRCRSSESVLQTGLCDTVPLICIHAMV